MVQLSTFSQKLFYLFGGKNSWEHTFLYYDRLYLKCLQVYNIVYLMTIFHDRVPYFPQCSKLLEPQRFFPEKSPIWLLEYSEADCVSYDLSLFWLCRTNSIFFIVGSLFHTSSLMTQSLCLSHPRGILEYLAESFWRGEESRNLMVSVTLLLQ